MGDLGFVCDSEGLGLGLGLGTIWGWLLGAVGLLEVGYCFVGGVVVDFVD